MMNPRYKSNKKWTELPQEIKTQINSIFEQNFAAEIGKNGEIRTEGRIYAKELLIRVGVHKKGELRFNNFEVSLDHNNEQDKVLELIYLAVDAIGSLMAEFFENAEEIELPYTWMEYPFNGHKVWLQFSTHNPDLESEADKILGIKKDALVIDELDNDEVTPDLLDVTEEEFDQFVEHLEPQMFKSKKKKDDLH